MYFRPLVALAIGVAFVLTSAPAGAERVTVQGRVIDAAGQPRADAVVSSFWNWQGDQPTKTGSFTVDETGAFRGELDLRGRPVTVLAYADNGSLAGMARVTEASTDNVAITLMPSVQVRGHIMCSELGGDAGSFSVYWTNQGSRIGVTRPADGRIDMKLPPGVWDYFIYGSNVQTERGKIELAEIATEHDMGTIDLPGTFVVLNRGRTVEDWNVTDARGVPIDKAQVRHYRGKWLLVEFWGYW